MVGQYIRAERRPSVGTVEGAVRAFDAPPLAQLAQSARSRSTLSALAGRPVRGVNSFAGRSHVAAQTRPNDTQWAS
jgi:hypothetical protein